MILLSEEAADVALGLGSVLFYVLIILGIILLLAGIFVSGVNCFYCIGLAIYGLCIYNGSTAANWAGPEAAQMVGWLMALWFGLRYLPCISVVSLKSTYLILGTLVQETESHLVGLGSVVAISAVAGFISYFIADGLFTAGHWGAIIIFPIFCIVWAIGCFVKGCITGFGD